MPSYPYEKKPAFFRVLSPELFFEADSERCGDLESSLSQLSGQPDLEAELDAILREAQIGSGDVALSVK
jgi:hypothetical protein